MKQTISEMEDRSIYSCKNPNNTMNANNSERISDFSDDSDFEIEITKGLLADTVYVDIVPKHTEIEFRQNQQCLSTRDKEKVNTQGELGTEKTNFKTKAIEQTDLKEPPVLITNNKPDKPYTAQKGKCKTKEKSDLQEEHSDCYCNGWVSDESEGDEFDDSDDIKIIIINGECPGTISINIEYSDLESSVQDEKISSDNPCQSRAKPIPETETNTSLQNYVRESGDKVPDPQLLNKNNTEREDDLQENQIIILSNRVPAKSRTSQSSPCLPISEKTKRISPKSGTESTEIATRETDHTSDVYSRYANLHDASDLTSLHRFDEAEAASNISNDGLEAKTIAKSTNKRNQELTDKTHTMKRFKGTSNLLATRRHGTVGHGDFIHSTSDKDKSHSILDEVDPVIPRVIPKSGKQVKFGDEIRGNRLIQLSPEKRVSSNDISPNKAERSILKKSSNANGIEPQVYYNSYYLDEDSDSKDSGLSDGEDSRRWEYRNDGYRSPDEYCHFFDPTYPAATIPYQTVTRQSHFCPKDDSHYVSHGQSNEYHQSVRTYSDSESSKYSDRHADRYRSIPQENYISDRYYPSQNSPSPSENHPRILQRETSIREKHSPSPSFIKPGFDDSKKTVQTKKNNSNKQARRGKKKQCKKGNKNGSESDLERFRRMLSTGQVRLASRGNVDVRKIKLEYLLHIGDFSLKYKTAPGLTDAMTLTIYTDVVGSSIDVRHMLHMQSNFINRLRFYLRRGNEVWLMHRFLHIGALQVLMNRDPYRDVLGEVHAQFITAGLLIGINYLHQNGITHGNLYPWKILINDRGYPVLTGFLPLHDSDDPVTCELRERRSYIFSVPYAAPDRFIGDMHPSVDIFSIGCIAYEIVTGRTPFYGGSEERTKEYILSYSYRPVYEYDTFSFAGEMFIDSCLRKHSAHRFVPGRHLSNLYHEEWFSTLDLGRYEDQTLDSPILDVIQILHEGETLDLEERKLDYDWGRVMDVMSPHAPTLVC